MVDKNISISGLFYNKRNALTITSNINKRARIIQQNPIPDDRPVSILGESQICKIFNRQARAIEFAKNKDLGLMVFAYEGKAIGEGGKRNFIACHPQVLWKNIKDRPSTYRCTYEVISEGSVCKLYFDLEFSKELNKEVDGISLTQTFISIVNYYIEKEFSICCNLNHVLDLDSSNERKFSKHLIYNCKELYFTNNYHIGRFVYMICNNLRELIDDDHSELNIPNINRKEIEKLFVNSGSSNTLFCDQGVYTKNRNFRTYKSTKLGKESPLIISRYNKYIPKDPDDENYFLDSLITFVPENVKLLTYGEDNSKIRLQNRKADSSKILSSNQINSPYPEIENYISNYLGDTNLIKGWKYFNDKELLVFEIDKRHRFCNNIGREHKSNSVMYVVNLRQGVFYQKCYDTECKDFKSNEMPLPLDTMPWKLLDESPPLDEEESLLVEAAERIEQLERMKLQNLDELLQPRSPNENLYKINSFIKMDPSIMQIYNSPNCKNSQNKAELSAVLPSPWNNLSQIDSPNKSHLNDTNESRSQKEFSESNWEISDDEILKITNIIEMGISDKLKN